MATLLPLTEKLELLKNKLSMISNKSDSVIGKKLRTTHKTKAKFADVHPPTQLWHRGTYRFILCGPMWRGYVCAQQLFTILLNTVSGRWKAFSMIKRGLLMLNEESYLLSAVMFVVVILTWAKISLITDTIKMKQIYRITERFNRSRIFTCWQPQNYFNVSYEHSFRYH